MKYKKILAATTAVLLLQTCATDVTLFDAQADSTDNGVIINEICSQNKSGLTDSYGKHADWIELYNAGTTTVDLTGYALSDSESNLQKFVFPSGAKIQSGEYLVVFASENPSTDTEYHTGFSLSKNGETLILSGADGTILEQVVFPALAEDTTYGRTASDTFAEMAPTPNAVNASAVATPTFSADSGFYGTDFALSLSADTGMEIYYTTDGSDPLTSDTAQLYTSEITVKDRTDEANLYSTYAEDESSAQSISRGTGYKKPTFNIDKATVVRAVAKNADGVASDVVDRTYFVTTGNLSAYENYTVVSLVTNPDNLFDPDTGIYVTGTQFLNWKNSSDYNPTGNAWDDSLPCNYYSRGSEWEREASITIFENGETTVSQNMGIRIKGSSTRNTPQKSFNLYARTKYGSSKINNAIFPDNTGYDGEVIDKYDVLTLRSVSDDSRLDDNFAADLLQDRTDLGTSAMKPCVVFLDGEYWGMYTMVEQISDEYVSHHYGIDSDDVTMIKEGEYDCGSESECDEFIDFAYTYANLDLTDEKNYQKVCDTIDIDSMIEHFASGLYLGTWDWPNHNYAMWKNSGEVSADNPYSDGKWRFISFDMDYTIGKTYESFGGVQGYAYNSFTHMDNASVYCPTKLFIALLKNETFRSKFIQVYREYADDVMSIDKVNALIDSYKTTRTELFANSLVRWWGFYGGSKSSLLSYQRSEFDGTVISRIRTFFENRAQYTLEDMEEYLGIDTTIMGDVNLDGLCNADDVTALQEWLIQEDDAVLYSKEHADMDGNGTIDNMDLLMLRSTLN